MANTFSRNNRRQKNMDCLHNVQGYANSYDLIIRNSFVEDQETIVDLGIKDGKIQQISPRIHIKGVTEIDANGFLVSPPLIDSHTHLDKCFLQSKPNQSGTLFEAIDIMSGAKGEILLLSFEQRVEQALRLAVKNGTSCIRTHVDIDSINKIKPVEMMLRIKKRWSELIDIEIVAFPQEGIMKNPEILDSLRSAIELGVDVIGGIPAIENSSTDSRKHIEHIFNLAVEFNLPVDMHIDESDNPKSRTLEMLAEITIDTRWQNRVCAAHCCSLASQDDMYAQKVINLVSRAGITIITNPTANLVLQGRDDRQPIRRGITRVKELLQAGVNVTCGNDNLRDAFYPFGQGDMLEVAFITSLAAHMTGLNEIKTILDMPRKKAAHGIGYIDYGIIEGRRADLIIIPVKNLTDLLALRPPRLAVIRNGKVICKTTQETHLTNVYRGQQEDF